jgi:hypothetical protein
MLTIVLVVFSYLLQIMPKTIAIDVSRNDKLNISQIASEVKAIPLNFLDLDAPYVAQLIVAPTCLYVSVDDISTGGEMEIYQIKKDGTLIRQVGLKDNETKGFLKARSIFYIDETNELLISYQDYSSIFDVNGAFKRKVENMSITSYSCQIFNNKRWRNYFITQPGAKVYCLTSIDLITQRKDTLNRYELITNLRHGPFLSSSLSVADNKLYFSNDYERELLSIDCNNKVEEPYRFEFKNLGKNKVDTLGGFRSVVFNKYIDYGYSLNDLTNRYRYIYDRTSGTGYNVDLCFDRRSNHNKSGIKDDIFDTGYFLLSNTNSGDYAFYHKNGSLVSGKVKGVKNEKTPVVFLIKFK